MCARASVSCPHKPASVGTACLQPLPLSHNSAEKEEAAPGGPPPTLCRACTPQLRTPDCRFPFSPVHLVLSPAHESHIQGEPGARACMVAGWAGSCSGLRITQVSLLISRILGIPIICLALCPSPTTVTIPRTLDLGRHEFIPASHLQHPRSPVPPCPWPDPVLGMPRRRGTAASWQLDTAGHQ